LYQQAGGAGAIVPAELQGLRVNQESWMQYCTPQDLSFEVIADHGVGALGFKPSGMPPARVFVEAVDADSWSGQVGIDIGDELIAVNGTLVSEMSAVELRSMRTERPLTLSLRREEPAGEAFSDPMVVAGPMPSNWAVNSVNELIAPHAREQFRKTKMCTFHAQSRCEMGSSCPFAHAMHELQPAPDLVKTKLCYNFFCKRCSDSRCKFAHGAQELRSDWVNGLAIMYTCGSMANGGGGGMWSPAPMDMQAMMAMNPAQMMMGFSAGFGDGFMSSGMMQTGMGGMMQTGMGGEVDMMMGGSYGMAFDGTLIGAEALSESGTSSGMQGPGFSRGASWAEAAPVREGGASGRAAVAGRSIAGAAAGAEASGGSGSGVQTGSSEASGENSESHRRQSVTLQTVPDEKQVILREYGTFMESMSVREEMMEGSRQRSWSDSDLPAFRDAMEDSLIG